MGYRYSDRELASFQRVDVYRAALRVSRQGDAPIDPDKDDYEAIDFLFDIKMSVDEMINEDMDDMLDRSSELADGVVPYNNYKAAMAYAQLGLYDYDYIDDYTGREYASQIDNIRSTLFVFAEVAIRNLYARDRFID
jgi:hypothetical protein